MSDSSHLPTDAAPTPADASTADPAPSLFDNFGGHYSVLVDGVEVARFAPSSFWSEYAAENADRSDWTYEWVSTDGRGA